MRKQMKILLIAVVLVSAFVIAFQAVRIHHMKKQQEDQFYAHIAVAAQRFGEYKETGYVFMYEDALMELHSASSIAHLLGDGEAYESIYVVLLSIVGTYHSSPDDLALFTDDIIVALNDFTTYHDVENLYTKLNGIDKQLTAMMMERAEKVK